MPSGLQNIFNKLLPSRKNKVLVSASPLAPAQYFPHTPSAKASAVVGIAPTIAETYTSVEPPQTAHLEVGAGVGIIDITQEQFVLEMGMILFNAETMAIESETNHIKFRDALSNPEGIDTLFRAFRNSKFADVGRYRGQPIETNVYKFYREFRGVIHLNTDGQLYDAGLLY
mgnify:CR=1 FL=1|tara:strand:- start:347 stop:859 length:513 start_codon:yes stop_codon:yes gene_type:complete